MAALKIKPLDGADGYLRWEESVLLRLHTVDVAHVLTKDPPSGDGVSPEVAEKWARHDAICRGHILATLSDRVLPDYVRHATGRALWEAVARTYDLAWNPVDIDPMFKRFFEFRFEEDGDVLEQLEHAEALAAAKKDSPLSDGAMARWMCRKLPGELGSVMRVLSWDDDMGMEKVWRVARRHEEMRIDIAEHHQTDETTDDEQEVKGKKGSYGHRRP